MMSAAEHLARAIELADIADILFRAAAPGATPAKALPERLEQLEAARTAAAMAEARAAIAWASIVDDPDMPHPGPALGVAAPVLNLPMRPDTRRAAPETPGTAADTPASHPHEGNVRS